MVHFKMFDVLKKILFVKYYFLVDILINLSVMVEMLHEKVYNQFIRRMVVQ